MKKMIKRALSAVLSATMLLSLCACGSGNTDAGGSADGGTGGTEGAELRFLDTNPNATRQEYYEKMFAQIEDELGIKVTYESTPLDDAANKITVMASAGSLPDIMTVQDNWKGQFTASEYIIPLEDYLAGTEDEYADTVTNIVWANEQEMYNHIYTVPDGMMVKGIFVRKDWAEEKGIELSYDWDYDEYFQVIEALTDESNNQYGMTYRGIRGAFDPIMVYLQSYTGGSTYDEEGNCLFRTEECLKAFEKYTNTYLSGQAPKDSINWGFTEMCDNFIGGLTGTLNNDSEVAALCLADMEDSEWTVLPIPHSTVDGKIYNTVNAPYSYTISSDCENSDAAWQVIEYLGKPENNIEYCKLTGEIPIKKDVGDDPYFGADGVYATFVQELSDPDLVVPTGYGAWDSTEIQQGPLYEEIQKYLLGEEDSKTCLNNICDMLETGMKTYLAENDGATVDTPKTMK